MIPPGVVDNGAPLAEDETAWLEWGYLQRGNPRQQSAFHTLARLAIADRLAPYDPVLVGTIPLGVDVADSDLDIICRVAACSAFAALVEDHYGNYPHFRLKSTVWQGLPTVVARFVCQPFAVEIFGQDQAVTAQNGFRHLVVEHRLLRLGGPTARRSIRRLKQAGHRTEPAFAHYFRLPGDPYVTLRQLSYLNEPALDRFLNGEL